LPPALFLESERGILARRQDLREEQYKSIVNGHLKRQKKPRLRAKLS